MDMIRTAYTTRMRFFEGGPLVPVRWYFADKGAKTFPKYHRFASGAFTLEHHEENAIKFYDGPGEPVPRYFERDDFNGANLLGTTGRNFCGKVEVFMRGQVDTDPTWTTDAEGRSPCCDRGRPMGAAGQLNGGSAFWPYPVFWEIVRAGFTEGGRVNDLAGQVDASKGGEAESGRVVDVPGVSDRVKGGEAEGGRARETLQALDRATGGEVEGGYTREGFHTVDATWGGETEGGGVLDFATSLDLTSGGEQEGGLTADTLAEAEQVKGGEVEGGKVLDFFGAVPTFGGFSFNSAAGGLSLTVPKPAGTVNGDVLVAVVALECPGPMVATPILPGGWTSAGMFSSAGNLGGALYWKRAGPSEPTSYGFGFSGPGAPSLLACAIARVSNATTATVTSPNNATGTTATAPALTLSGGPATFLGCFTAKAAGGTITPQSPLIADRAGGSVAVGHVDTTANSWPASTATLASSAEWRAWTVGVH